MRVRYEPRTLLHSCGVTLQEVTLEDDRLVATAIAQTKKVFPLVYEYIQGNQGDWRFIEVWGDNQAIEIECAQWLAALLGETTPVLG